MSDYGKKVRLNRILKGRGRRALVVAFDHGLVLGPILGTTDPASQLQLFARSGVNAVLLNLGILRQCGESLLQQDAPAIILRLDWTSLWTAKEPLENGRLRSSLVARPEEALRYGADAALTYLFVGTGDADFDAEQVRLNAEVARECERLGLPLIIESLARGQDVSDPTDLKWMELHTRVAVELGADAIKTEYTGRPETMRSVVDSCPVPILVLGGSRQASDEHALSLVRAVVESGAAGVFFGRNAFQADDVAEFLHRARSILDG